jgi:hypothetical protein
MNDAELEALEAQYRKAVYPSHVAGANNIVFDSNLIEKGVRKLLDEVKATRLQIREKDEWIKALETRIDTQTRMLADAGIVKLREAEKRDVPVPACAACRGAFPGHQPGCPFSYDQPE